jgi:hypothetical protein
MRSRNLEVNWPTADAIFQYELELSQECIHQRSSDQRSASCHTVHIAELCDDFQHRRGHFQPGGHGVLHISSQPAS